MHSLRAFILLLILFASTEVSSGPEADRLLEENSLLKAEVQLAKLPKIYVIFDLAAKNIAIKARGILLKELPVESYSRWGTPVPPRSLRLLSKTALVKPERKEIIPKAEGTEDTEDISEPVALQLEDMPLRYELILDQGIQISVKPRSTGVISTLFNLVASLKSYLMTRPLRTLWNALRGKSFTEIVLVMDENDARSLYWSFQEGFQCIIWTDPPA
jgi:hypothetical protein